ncbi:hypothetical protein LCGC14_1785640 [marine sediment metagenome]|uniref:Uncharacterized protein n=1 Tax=marine sediment metagenome TaxID=412755 RepID=A0A0F9HGL6_9ZZZZ
MNWEAIKYIYCRVLIYDHKIEYLGGDKYKIITFYPTGEIWWEAEYQNGQLHGKYIGWYPDGQKNYEEEYQNGKQIK